MEKTEASVAACLVITVGFLLSQAIGCDRELNTQRHQQAIAREARLAEEQKSIQAAIKAGAAIEHGRTVIIMPRAEE